jgi:type II secretory pathway pseudopilin PulG
MVFVPKRRKDGRANTSGLTLVELVVVIAMTALLSALLFPALSTAKEKSLRAVCKSNIRELYVALWMSSEENGDILPSCADNKGYYHSIRLSDEVFTNLVAQAGGNSNIFYCPNVIFGPTHSPVQQHDQYGYVIGYSYLAASIYGSPKSPDSMLEPVKWPASSTNELLADANYWTPAQAASSGYFPSLMKVAPHAAMGPILSKGSAFTVGLPGKSSASIGAVGGNIGLVDGSVQWRNISLMQTNAASSLEDAYGAW